MVLGWGSVGLLWLNDARRARVWCRLLSRLFTLLLVGLALHRVKTH